MLQSMEELYSLINSGNAAVKDLSSTLERTRKELGSVIARLHEDIRQLNTEIEGLQTSLSQSRAEGMDACEKISCLKLTNAVQEAGLQAQAAGLRVLGDSVVWLTKNQRTS